jgi:Delta3-Delta2-enoyl-CoA isomerase
MASHSLASLFAEDGVSLTAAPSGVLTLTLSRTENLINSTMVDLLSRALTVVEQASHPKALCITAEGKFFSNGLDVTWMGENAGEALSMIKAFWRVLARLLVLDCHTVAAINGHAFGGGLFIALACDHRVMRTERGFACFPELNLGMRLSKAFAELAKVLDTAWRLVGTW